MCLPPRAPPGPEAALTPDPVPGEVPAVAAALPPALPEIVEPPFQQALIPAMETSGQCPQNSISAGPPRWYPPLSVSTGIIQRLCSAKEQGERSPLQMPLRELQQPPVQDAHGHYHQLLVAYHYQSFSSTETLNWQKHTPPYSGESRAMISLMETIF